MTVNIYYGLTTRQGATFGSINADDRHSYSTWHVLPDRKRINVKVSWYYFGNVWLVPYLSFYPSPVRQDVIPSFSFILSIIILSSFFHINATRGGIKGWHDNTGLSKRPAGPEKDGVMMVGMMWWRRTKWDNSNDELLVYHIIDPRYQPSSSLHAYSVRQDVYMTRQY